MIIPRPLTWAISGMCLGIPFVFEGLWFVVIVGFLVLFSTIKQARSNTEVVFGAMLTGILMYLCVVSWYWSAYPLEGIKETQYVLQFSIIGLYWFLTGLVLAPGVVVFSLLVRRVIQTELLFLLCAPVLWVLTELYSIFLFSVGSYGAGGVIGFHFGFPHVGNTVASTAFFLWFGSFYGVYAMSFAVAAFSCLIFVCIQKRMFVPLITMLLLLPLSSYVIQNETVVAPRPQHIVVVETQFDKVFFKNPDSYALKAAAILEAVDTALKENPDVIILPEDSRFTESFATSDDVLLFLKENNNEFDGVLIDSGRFANEDGETVMRAFIYDAQSHSVTYTDKQYLVPQGEFIPYLFVSLLPRVLSPLVWEALSDRLSYVRGRDGTIASSAPSVPALLFCSESVSPFGVKKALGKHNGSFVAHPISHAWYNSPYTMWKQLDAMLRIQAHWSKTPIISAGNMAESKLYTASGAILKGDLVVEGDLWSIKRFDLR